VTHINRTVKKLCPILTAALMLAYAFTPLPAAGDASEAAYDRIIQKKVIRIGISQHYPPLNFYSGKNGVEIDMAQELGRFLGVGIETVPLKLTEYVGAIEHKKVDIVIAGLSRNLRRATRIWFSEPYISVTPGVLASTRALPQTRFGDRFEQNPIRTIWDLKSISGFRFAVKEGSAYEELLENEFPDFRGY
jgi:ABC-type amino acid transport substrate-binding protein